MFCPSLNKESPVTPPGDEVVVSNLINEPTVAAQELRQANQVPADTSSRKNSTAGRPKGKMDFKFKCQTCFKVCNI